MKLHLIETRPRVSAHLIATVASRLTERDRYLCQILWDHRVLTTHQVRDLAFTSTKAAEHRLLTLYRLRVLDRFRPTRTYGSAPFHYVLDELGAWVVASTRGTDPVGLGYRRDKTLSIAYSQRLAHLVGVNGFFTALAADARRPAADSGLLRWWSESRCAAAWGDIVRPDGYGRWRERGVEVDFFLEYDRGTERPARRLVDRLTDYADLADATGITTPVLIWLPNARRETTLRRLLARPPGPVATTHPIAGCSPADEVWWPAGRDDLIRRRLAALAKAAE